MTGTVVGKRESARARRNVSLSASSFASPTPKVLNHPQAILSISTETMAILRLKGPYFCSLEMIVTYEENGLSFMADGTEWM